MRSNKKILWRICAFVLVFATVCQCSLTATAAAGELVGNMLRSVYNSASLLSTDGDSGIDLYTVNGQYLTIKGHGVYATPTNENNSFGDTKYILNCQTPLTKATELRVAKDVSATVTLAGVNSVDHLKVILEENAKLELIISGECGIGEIVLGSNSEISLSGASLGLGDITVEDGAESTSVSFDTLEAISLGGSINAHSISLVSVELEGTTESSIVSEGSMTVDNAVINAKDGESLNTISTKGDLTVKGNSTAISVKNIGVAVGGKGRVSLIGIGSIKTEYLGALPGEGTAFAMPVSLEMTLEGAPVQVWDYTIAYMNYGDLGYEAMTFDSGDVSTAYRVRTEGGVNTLEGYHSADGYVEGQTSPVMPSPTRKNYEFRVWSVLPMADDANYAVDKTSEEWLVYDGKEWDAENGIIKDSGADVGYSAAAITSDRGNVTLYAVYVPESVVVKIHTNINDDKVFALFPAYVGAKGVSLQGYLDDPVLDIEGQDPQTFADAPKDGNSVNVSSFSVSEDDGDGVIDLYVVWSSGHIRVDYNVPEYYEGYNYQYLDSNGNWVDIPASSLAELNEQIKALVGALDIYYGSPYGEMLTIRCLRPDGVEGFEYNFVGWYIQSSTGDKIMLDKDTVVSSETTTSNALTTGSQTIYALFENTRYTLTVPSSLGKWQFLDGNGNVIAFTSNGDGTMSAYVNSDTTVVMKRADETTVSSYWRLTNGTTNAFIWPAERSQTKGGSYWLFYEFTMPKANVTAVYDEKVRWDTAMGDYTFGTFEFNGRSSYGFRITDRYTGDVLHQFRWIMTSNTTTVYFTSSKETDHQIKLDAATNLYLDGVKLAERGDILNQLSDFYSSGVYVKDLKTYPFAANQNIIIDNNPDVPQTYNTSTSYTVNVYILADSKVFAVGQKSWLNNITNKWSQTYRSKMVIDGKNNELEIYSLLLHTKGSSLKNCNVDVLTTDDTAIDSKVHWFHFDSDDGTISSCRINANGRSMYMRHGGSMSGTGNGVTFTISTNSVLQNFGDINIPFVKITDSTVEADRILSIGYGFNFTNSTVVANVIGYAGAIHVGYTNSTSSFSNCNITVNDWMSLSRPRIYGGTVLTVKNGLHLFESLQIYGSKTTVNVGSFERFRTTLGNTSQDGKHYTDTDSNHFFYIDIYSGAKVTVEGDMNVGVNHSSMPTIDVYGNGTVLEVKGNADITNTMNVTSGATVKVSGDLTFHQDLSVNSGTLTVGGNLYHTIDTAKGDSEYKTVTDANGTTESVFWTFDFADSATVNVGGDVGDKLTTDKTNVVYSASNTNFTVGGKVIRDIQIIYTIPDGFAGDPRNPASIRLENNTYVGSNVNFYAPIKTGDMPLEFEDDCWYSGDTLFSSITAGDSFTNDISIIRLEARVKDYVLDIDSDDGAILGLQYQEKDSSEWVSAAGTDGRVKIPIDATVKLTVSNEYASLVFAESFLNGTYTPVAIEKSSDGTVCTVTFVMDNVQIMLRVLKQFTLYLDEGHIHVKEVNGEIGFARYGGTGFMPYAGSLIVTQKNTSVSCPNTLYIERSVDKDTSKVTLTGIVVKNLAESVYDTVYFAPGVVAAIHLSGKNQIRNIRVPQNADVTIIGDAGAEISLVNTPHFSGSYSSVDTSRYYAQIGDYTCGKITMIGGKYTSYGSFNHQGSAVSVGGISSVAGNDLTLTGIEFISNGYLNPRWFSVPSSNIYVKDSRLNVKTHSGNPFSCKNITVEGNSSITFSYNTGNDYTVSAFSGVSNTVVLKDNVIVEDFYNGTPNNSFMAVTPNQTMTLSGNASYITHGNLILSSLTVKDNAALTAVGGTDSMARAIAAKEINISGGQINCGFLIVSGYFNTQGAGADLINAYFNAPASIISSGTLNVSGGVINATGGKIYIVTENDPDGVLTQVGGIVGGSRGAVINITGGAVNASVIGDSEYAFSLFRRGVYVIKDGNATGADMDISGGALSFDKLGGNKANVTILGSARVEMKAGSQLLGSVITVTDDASIVTNADTVIGGDRAQITLEGNSKIYGAGDSDTLASIIARNGELTVTDNASVHVALVNIEGGEIVVSTTNRDLTNKYTYGHSNVGGESIGLFVDHGSDPTEASTEPMGTVKGDLAAKNITVKTQAYVSAYRVGSNAVMSTNGDVVLEAYSYLYTYAYGAFGSGTIEVDRDDQSVVNGKLQISVNYDLNLGEGSSEKIEDIMPSTGVLHNYTPTGKDEPVEQLPLPAPERKGYIFDGWYYVGEIGTGAKQEFVLSNREAATNLVAKWTPVRIPINLKGDSENTLDKWLDYEFGATTFTPESYMVGGQYSSSYIISKADAGKAWATIFGVEKMMPAGTPFVINAALYDAYLKQNGVDYSDGLTDAEKATIRRIEGSSATVQDAGIEYVTLYAYWSTAVHNISFDAKDKNVDKFQYGDEILDITKFGTGIQEVSAYVGIPYANGLYVNGVNMKGIPIPMRKGYNFIKWISIGGESFDLTLENSTELKIDEYTENFEAEYVAKKFRVFLIPDNGYIQGTTILDGENKITVNGVDVYYLDGVEFDASFGHTLPEAQLFGYVYRGWELKLKNGSSVPFNSATVIKWDSGDVILPAGYEALATGLPAGIDDYLILTPITQKTVITYDMHGGQWTDKVSAAEKESYKHLLGDSENHTADVLPTVNYTITDGVYSITDPANAFINSVERHGYRFLGWATEEVYTAWKSSGESVETYFDQDGPGTFIEKSTVNYFDVTYHAIWKACTYKLELVSRKGETWSNDYFTNGAIAVVNYSVDESTHPTFITVGQPAGLPNPKLEDANIKYEVEGDSESHSARKLLGWMFDGAANPVTDYYNKDGSADPEYARLIALSMNRKELFEGDDVFVLPDTQTDPGDGGTITLYAVYRERSLIFVLCTPEGEQSIQLIADYDVKRSGYTSVSENITAPKFEGYNLSGWYVNTTEPKATNDYTWYGLESVNHPLHAQYYVKVDGDYVKRKDNYGNELLNGTYTMDYYVNNTASNNNYDIYVYSYYAPQLQSDLALFAQAGKPQYNQINKYTVPDTMKVQSPTDGSSPILYSVSVEPQNGGVITFVDRSVIEKWYSDPNYYGKESWTDNGITYYANSTFAIDMIVNTGSSEWVVPIKECSSVYNAAYITAGSDIEFVVYSTNRLVSTQSLGTINVTVEFPTLALAMLTFNAEFTRAAAQYELDLDANTPSHETFEDITWTAATGVNVYTRSNEIKWMEFLCGSGREILPLLALKGYTFNGWKDEGGNLIKENDLLIYVPPMGSSSTYYKAQTLEAEWEINRYEFKIDEGTATNKAFGFIDKDGTPITVIPSGNIYMVPYKATVQLTTNVGCEANGYPEFITVWDENGASYGMDDSQKLVMPAYDLDVKFDRVKILNTSNEDILIDDETYQIGSGVPVVWRGDYILSADGGILSINTSNEVEGRDITHSFTLDGKTDRVVVSNSTETLEISVDDAIVENIEAPATDLTLSGAQNGGILTMLPSDGAAIKAENVSVEDLTLNVRLTQYQPAGNVDTSAIQATGKIELNGITFNAISYSQAATYVGTVLVAPDIAIIDSDVKVGPYNNGCPVSSDACFIGAGTGKIYISGKGSSGIDSDMQINAPGARLDILDNASVVMNGQNANVTVKDIYVDQANGSDSSASNSYSVLTALAAIIDGDQTIGIYSDVIDHNGRHLDVRAAAIEITANGYSHGGRDVSEKSPYVLVGTYKSGNKNAVSIVSPFEQIYLDSNSIGKITAAGTVKLVLLDGSEIDGIIGSEADVSIDGEFDLKSNGDIIAHILSVKSTVIDAEGCKVGSEGNAVDGKIGRVTLDGATVSATTVGALGDYDKSFTAVELKNGATVNGKLVKDLYRLEYEIESNTLPHTLRSSTDINGTTFTPARPDVLSGIEFWYIKDSFSGEFHPLLEGSLSEVYENAGLDSISSLTDEHIEWAADTIPNDSTKTLMIYAWMKLTLNESITTDRELDKITASTDKINIRADGAWTAQFVIEGTIISGSSYELTLSAPFPKGTMLTLMDMSGTLVSYYYYECSGSETTILLSAFKKMGTSDSDPDLLSGITGDEISDTLQISADFSTAETAVASSDISVSLKMLIGGTDLLHGDSSLAYELTSVPTASVQVSDSNVTVSYPKVDGHVYLTAKIASAVTAYMPYDALFALGEAYGTKVGRNIWVFDLGIPASDVSETYTWSVSSIPAGTYSIEWYLSCDADGKNVLSNILAEAQCTYTENVKAEPYMSVTFEDITSRVVTINVEHRIAFVVDTNKTAATSAQVWSDNDGFVGTDIISIENNDIVLPANLRKGTYRVCFSIDENSANDNVYFTFIVK